MRFKKFSGAARAHAAGDLTRERIAADPMPPLAPHAFAPRRQPEFNFFEKIHLEIVFLIPPSARAAILHRASATRIVLPKIPT